MTNWEAIEVPLTNGKVVRVILDVVVGAFGVHKRIWGGEPVGPEWTVTHRETGQVMWIVKEYADALKVAQWLDAQQSVPATRDAAWAWANLLSPQDKAQLQAQLQAIAPRYVPPPYANLANAQSLLPHT